MARRHIHSELTSRLAIWARRIAGFALAAAFLAVIIVRSGLLEVQPAIATFAGALALAVIAPAVARTPMMVCRDDVVVRVRAEPEGARIDARSSSRYGSFDFGTNAARVRSLFNDIEDAIRAQRPERPPTPPPGKKSTGKKDQRK